MWRAICPLHLYEDGAELAPVFDWNVRDQVAVAEPATAVAEQPPGRAATATALYQIPGANGRVCVPTFTPTDAQIVPESALMTAAVPPLPGTAATDMALAVGVATASPEMKAIESSVLLRALDRSAGVPKFVADPAE